MQCNSQMAAILKLSAHSRVYNKISFSAMCFHCSYNKTLECVVMLDRRTSNIT